jgi:hypothetical protein
MTYCVRLLITSEKTLPFSEIARQGKCLKLMGGTETAWELIEIYEPKDNLICRLQRSPVSAGSSSESELNRLRSLIQGSYPTSAREWIRNYLSRVKTVYVFQLYPDGITHDGWPVLGRIQNLLKDLLHGIIQADNEGFYNEIGDYILWQMYAGATGIIPVATLDDQGEWVAYRLNLNNPQAIEGFKQGQVPPRGFLSRLLGRR